MSRRVASIHADWLTLVEPSGPFLTLPVLRRVWPNGLDHLDGDTRTEVRRHLADLDTDDAASATSWIEWVLRDLLAYGRRLAVGPAVPATLAHVVAEHATVLRPDYALVEPAGDGTTHPRLLVTVHPPGTRLDVRLGGDRWSATPIERLALLCRATGVELGLATNGAAWVLVWAPRDSATGRATFSADLFSEEPVLLDAFTSVLGARRFFAAADGDRLEQLLAESASAQAEVTGKLGQQVRQAVELLVGAMSRADRERQGELLAETGPHQVYEAAVGVLMRCVFLLYAEERGLLPLGDDLYDRTLAASTLLDQLREIADLAGDEPLERSTTAWHRLLALFRAVHGGIAHDQLRLPAYGGGLFDPDRFPFLEGRRPGELWHDTPATPVPVDDLTVLDMLAALQELRFTEAGVTETRRLTYRSLDVEQIGHVYEGLLDHSAVTLKGTAVGLIGKAGIEPEVALDDLTAAAAKGRDAFVAWLAETTTRTPRQLERLLDTTADADTLRLLRAACDNDETLTARLAPYVHLLRPNLRGLPTVFPGGTMYVTQTGAKRDSGTAYTTHELAEEVVHHALEPLVYDPGPADDADPADWRLRNAGELLDLKVCDPAVGSGAILVAACRYLANRLVEAWTVAGAPEAEGDPDEVVIAARRAVADRCIYGVDRDPMAVEMAKVSLWLVTLSKERPFSFLDHALKAGDSLLGITSLDQLLHLHLDPAMGLRRQLAIGENPAVVDAAVKHAVELRRELEAIPVVTVRDAEDKARLDTAATAELAALRKVADLVVGCALRAELPSQSAAEDQIAASAPLIVAALDPDQPDDLRTLALGQVEQRAHEALNAGRPEGARHRNPLHWPLTFPELFVDRERWGFDAMVANPPYMGNKYWRDRLGSNIQPYFASLFRRRLGKPDLIVLFIWRMCDLVCIGGTVGTLATQSVSEVDSKALMQEIVLNNSEIFRAIRSRQWPGAAAVVVSLLWLVKGTWKGVSVLDGFVVPGVGADLRESLGDEPVQLADSLFAFQGIDNSKGNAFVVPADHPLCGHTKLFRPYLSGEDLTQRNPLLPQRFAMDLTGLRAEDLESLPEDVRTFLFDVVHPARTAAELHAYEGLGDRWWTFWRSREDGFAVVRRLEYCIAVAGIAKYLVPLAIPSAWIYTNKAVVVAMTREDIQALLLSPAFDIWVEKYGGTLGEGRCMKVGPVTRTWPLPTISINAGLAGAWQDAVLDALQAFGPGVTDVLNRVHDPDCDSPLIVRIRETYESIHAAVIKAYDWGDLSLTLSHVELPEGTRWGLSGESRLNLLGRLLELNHRRYAEEVADGLHHKKKGGRKTARPKAGMEGLRLL